ncbi:FKBP-type peptidyl-prolyl cis-trans isomerase [Pseudomonas sp. dw_358]|uniref:FKBP-type peptidyl-prolyl cis-trans isomerase n=1 Tax=Pseudomonas sp. dw_358 TaxID=2720083 RepID=UPI001BD5C2A8|nr:FKBP-type peptidyl-prolyl cis-trans isomerase [Pseudomonas sp. dw_358]
MLRTLLLPLLWIAPLAFADDPAPVTSPHDLAYSVGASLGERLHQEVPDLELQALIEGLQQAYEGKPLTLSNERIEQILNEHDALMTQNQVQSKVDIALAAEQKFMVDERAKPGVEVLDQGVLVTELSPGSGAKPKADSKVQVRYVGRLPDGTVFDENQQPQWFSLGSVITGWRIALQQMPTGAKWRVVIPSQLAYGTEGAGDLIAPNTPLVFEIELLAIAS